MHVDDTVAGQPLRCRGAHEVRGEVLGDGRPREPQDVGERHRTEHDRGHEQRREGDVTADRRWQPLELDADDELEDKTDHERGHRNDEEADEQKRRVEVAALAQPGDEAEADPEHGLDDDGHDRELEGHGEGVTHDVDDLATGERLAEVESQDALEVEQVLDEERLVQVELRPDLVGHRGVESAVTTEGRDGVTREPEDHGVDEQSGPQKHRDHL